MPKPTPPKIAGGYRSDSVPATGAIKATTSAHTDMSTPVSKGGRPSCCWKKKGKATNAKPWVVKELNEVNTDKLNKGLRIKSTGSTGAACPRWRRNKQ
jgi:hypothetical protein